MTFSFSQGTDVTDEVERLLKIAETEGAFDAMAVIAQFPIRSLRSKMLGFVRRKRRNTAATRGALLLGKSFGHDLALGPKENSLSQHNRITAFNLIVKRVSACRGSPNQFYDGKWLPLHPQSRNCQR